MSCTNLGQSVEMMRSWWEGLVGGYDRQLAGQEENKHGGQHGGGLTRLK